MGSLWQNIEDRIWDLETFPLSNTNRSGATLHLTLHSPLLTLKNHSVQRSQKGEPYERSRNIHRRRVQRQSRSGRLGRGAALQRSRKGAFRRRGEHHQQPHGAVRGDLRAGGAEGAVPREALQRLAVRLQRPHSRLGKKMARERLDAQQKGQGAQSRPVGAPA